ncbi:MAG: hypothetical protein ACFNP9_04770, partial [Porphyromonas endodontalis]
LDEIDAFVPLTAIEMGFVAFFMQAVDKLSAEAVDAHLHFVSTGQEEGIAGRLFSTHPYNLIKQWN